MGWSIRPSRFHQNFWGTTQNGGGWTSSVMVIFPGCYGLFYMLFIMFISLQLGGCTCCYRYISSWAPFMVQWSIGVATNMVIRITIMMMIQKIPSLLIFSCWVSCSRTTTISTPTVPILQNVGGKLTRFIPF